MSNLFGNNSDKYMKTFNYHISINILIFCLPTNIVPSSSKDISERTSLRTNIALLKLTKFVYKIYLICQSSTSIKKEVILCEPMLAPNDRCFFSQMLSKHLLNNYQKFTKFSHVMPRDLAFILCTRGESLCFYSYFYV